VLLVPAGPVSGQSNPGEGLTTIYLVRHAERADDHPSDPTLTPAGSERARELARVLEDVPLDAIHSTDYRRTRLTAAPLAEEKGLEVELYDPSGPGMDELGRTLRASGGYHLVVGHSNTTPALVDALGGASVSPVAEDEYDRLYVVVLGPEGTVTSSLLRFGAEARGGS
jgi:phosphohistidine phosphatase SixA